MASAAPAAAEESASKAAENVSQDPTVKSDWEVAPWDRHAGVLKMARFDYRREELLRSGNGGGIQGFLITCAFRREKSATSEALSILPKYLPAVCASVTEGEELEAAEEGKHGADSNVGLEGSAAAKRQRVETGEERGEEGKLKGEEGKGEGEEEGKEEGGTKEGGNAERSTVEEGEDGAKDKEDKAAAEDCEKTVMETGEGKAMKVSKAEQDASAAEDALKAGLGAVKLGSMGITFLALPEKEKCVPGSEVPCPVDVVGQILKVINEKKRSGLKWCQRICPVQATCPTTKRHLSTTVCRLLTNHFAAASPAKPAGTSSPTPTPTPAAAAGGGAEVGVEEPRSNGSETAAEPPAAPQQLLPPIQFAVAFKKRGAEDSGAAAKETAKKEKEKAERQREGNAGEASGKRGAAANLTNPEPRQQPEHPRQHHLRHHYVPPVETPSHRAARAAAWAARDRSRARPRQQGERRVSAERGDWGQGHGREPIGGNSAELPRGLSAGHSASAASSKGAVGAGDAVSRSSAPLDAQEQARVEAEVRQIVHHAEAKARQQQQQKQLVPRQLLQLGPRGGIGRSEQRHATWIFPGHGTAPRAIFRQNAAALSHGLRNGLQQRFRQLSPFPLATRFRDPFEALKRSVLEAPSEAQKAVRAAVKRGEERVNSARLGAVMVVLGLWEVARNKVAQARQRHQVRSQVRVWGQRLGREAPVAAKWAMTSGWGETGDARGGGEGGAGEGMGERVSGGGGESFWGGNGEALGRPTPDIPSPDAFGLGIVRGLLGSGVLGWPRQRDEAAYSVEAYKEDGAWQQQEAILLGQSQALWRQVASLLNPPGSVAETPERLDPMAPEAPSVIDPHSQRKGNMSAGAPHVQVHSPLRHSPALPPSSPHPPLPPQPPRALLDPWAALQIAEEQFGAQLDSCGDLRIKVAATGQDLLSGRLAGVSVSARAAEYKGLSVSDVDMAASSVRFGKNWGLAPNFTDSHFPLRAFLSPSKTLPAFHVSLSPSPSPSSSPSPIPSP
ncbi:unnamed protein product [Closterium sp. NIES-64]|nr:unnamed protein product [Closterium sp. NIES-64]